jgi:hypothetical protein
MIDLDMSLESFDAVGAEVVDDVHLEVKEKKYFDDDCEVDADDVEKSDSVAVIPCLTVVVEVLLRAEVVLCCLLYHLLTHYVHQHRHYVDDEVRQKDDPLLSAKRATTNTLFPITSLLITLFSDRRSKERIPRVSSRNLLVATKLLP